MDESAFYRRLPEVRAAAGDRAVLRAIHVFDENRRAAAEAEALRHGDFGAFLALVNASGASSWQYLQNVAAADPRHQALALTLALCPPGAGRGGALYGYTAAALPGRRWPSCRRSCASASGRSSRRRWG